MTRRDPGAARPAARGPRGPRAPDVDEAASRERRRRRESRLAHGRRRRHVRRVDQSHVTAARAEHAPEAVMLPAHAPRGAVMTVPHQRGGGFRGRHVPLVRRRVFRIILQRVVTLMK